jgi:hypothetical protein
MSSTSTPAGFKRSPPRTWAKLVSRRQQIIMTHAAGAESDEQVFDFRTGQLSVVPPSKGLRVGSGLGQTNSLPLQTRIRVPTGLRVDQLGTLTGLQVPVLHHRGQEPQCHAHPYRRPENRVHHEPEKSSRVNHETSARTRADDTRCETRLLAWRAPATPLNVSLVPTFLLAPSIGSPT